ncbi:MAG: hypothetical protein IJQ59_04190 [Bacteroidaceae bacterium]|nr:hypothetical protein [Bacteroidaceae bacterium]
MSETYYSPLSHRETIEQTLQQWWQERFDTPLPDDVHKWLQELLRQEVSRVRLSERLLDDASLQQLHEGRRLCQTKMAHLEETRTEVQRQLERLHQFLKVNTELTKQQERLYQLNKQLATIHVEKQELERFEAFEPLNEQVQRIHLLSKDIEQTRQASGQQGIVTGEAKKAYENAEQQVHLEQGNTDSITQQLMTAAMKMADGEHMATQVSEGKSYAAETETIIRQLQERYATLEKELQENKRVTEEFLEEATELHIQQQALEVHRAMILRSDAVKIMLDELLGVQQLREQLTQELSQASRHQDERDEQLRRLFAEHQALNTAIQRKQDELDGHRTSIKGQDSYKLQSRAMELRSRLQMLKTASTLWHSIATDYDLMEQKEMEITRLRLHSEHLNRSLDKLDKEIQQAVQQLEHKEYHLTLSKSQDVIELRGDLQEGTPCTVCGATHHPWEGETIVEQNALIASLKAECAVFRQELSSKQKTLAELQKDLYQTVARMETEALNLTALRTRLNGDAEEWQNFRTLDKSFTDCSASTNRESRTTLLQLLIERTTVEAEEAEKELQAFTFHLGSISQVGEQMQQLQQQSDDLAVRLNEANTACQTMAGQVERLQKRQQDTIKAFRQRYDALEQVITLPEWYTQWKESPEGLKQRIQQMREQWDVMEQRLQGNEIETTRLKAEGNLLRQQQQQVIADLTARESALTTLHDKIDKADDAWHKLIPDGNTRNVFSQAQMAYTKQCDQLARMEKERDEKMKEWQKQDAFKKALDSHTLEMEQLIAEERRNVDLWMSRFNANHPPMQIGELERVLTGNRDWTGIRERVRSVLLDQSITQARIDYLRAQVIALQAEGLRPISDNGDAERSVLLEKLKEIEQQLRDVMLQQSQYEFRLQAHEQASEIHQHQPHE